jgi:hypothetical protein
MTCVVDEVRIQEFHRHGYMVECVDTDAEHVCMTKPRVMFMDPQNVGAECPAHRAGRPCSVCEANHG